MYTSTMAESKVADQLQSVQVWWWSACKAKSRLQWTFTVVFVVQEQLIAQRRGSEGGLCGRELDATDRGVGSQLELSEQAQASRSGQRAGDGRRGKGREGIVTP
jgi:hypothetical protein